MSATIVPPVDTRAEDMVVAELVTFSRAVGILTELGLHAEDFYSFRNAAIYRAAQRVMTEGGDVNEISIWAALQAIGEAHPKGCAIQRNDILILGNLGHFHGAAEYGRRIMERADRRRKLEAAQKLTAAVELESPENYEIAVQEALEYATVDRQVEAQPTTPDEIAMALHDYIESEKPAVFWPLPWPRLNQGLPGGLLPGQTSAWMGWTNHGKSAALDEAMRHWHGLGAKCALIGTEMGLYERMARNLQTVSGISSLKILTKNLDGDEKTRLSKLIQPETMPFHFHDAQGWTYQRIAQLITVKQYDIVAIDPLNLIPGFADQATMTEAARAFQSVARRSGSHLITVVHLNRKRTPGGMATKLPKPHHYDIRDSGMIANNADVVVGVFRDQDDEGEVLPTGEVYLDKVRVGFKRSQPVSLDTLYLTFKPILEDERREVVDLPGEIGSVGGDGPKF